MFCLLSGSCLIFFFYELLDLSSKSLTATVNAELEILLYLKVNTFVCLFAELLWNFLIQKLLVKIHTT